MYAWQFHPAEDWGLSGTQRFAAACRESGPLTSLLQHVWWFVIRAMLLFWNQLVITGAENLPKTGPFILVANHKSHLDTMALASALNAMQLDRLSPLAAADVFFQNSFISALSAHLLNALPLWRNRRCRGAHALRELRGRLMNRNSIYILFPEGGRIRNGKMASFKPGFGFLIAGTPVPIVPCYLQGTEEALPVGKRVVRPRKIRLIIGRPLTFEHLPNCRITWNLIAQTAQHEVQCLGARFSGLRYSKPTSRARPNLYRARTEDCPQTLFLGL